MLDSEGRAGVDRLASEDRGHLVDIGWNVVSRSRSVARVGNEVYSFVELEATRNHVVVIGGDHGNRVGTGLNLDVEWACNITSSVVLQLDILEVEADITFSFLRSEGTSYRGYGAEQQRRRCC